MTSDDRVKIRSVETLADDWATLKKYTFDYRRRDGTARDAGAPSL